MTDADTNASANANGSASASPTRVKICGLTRAMDVEVAVAAGTDAIGVVSDVSVDTLREVDPERAGELFRAAPPFVTTVLVTMPETATRAIELVERIEPDVLQLHGEIDLDMIETIRAATSVKIVFAIAATEVANAGAYDDLVDALLVDSADADGGGGTGETHDWERTREATTSLESPVILAGGLTPANVTDAIDVVEPFAVDVASGVEATGGVKDHDAVRSFVTRARGATAETETKTETETETELANDGPKTVNQ